MHATYLPEEPLQYADYVIRGEAEESFPALVRALEDRGSLGGVPNLVYRDGERTVHNPRQPLSKCLDEIPMPDLSLIEGHERLKIVPVLTTRGCPHGCTFCCVSDMFGRRYRMASIERVLEEVERYRRCFIFFCDDNFTAVPRRTKELLDRMLSRGLAPRRWYAQVRADACRDRELMKLLRRTNCCRVYVGFESVDQHVLDEYGKHQTVQDIRDAVAAFHRHDISVHGMFMFGAEHDDAETFARTIGFAIDAQIDTVQFLILTPIPGSALFCNLDAEGRIFTYDWSLYDGHHVVFEPSHMSPLELQLGTMRANRRFYSTPSVLRSLSSLGFGTAMMRYWGKRIVRAWYRTNAEFLKRLHSWQKRGVEFPRHFSLRRVFKSDPLQALLAQ